VWQRAVLTCRTPDGKEVIVFNVEVASRFMETLAKTSLGLPEDQVTKRVCACNGARPVSCVPRCPPLKSQLARWAVAMVGREEMIRNDVVCANIEGDSSDCETCTCDSLGCASPSESDDDGTLGSSYDALDVQADSAACLQKAQGLSFLSRFFDPKLEADKSSALRILGEHGAFRSDYALHRAKCFKGEFDANAPVSSHALQDNREFYVGKRSLDEPHLVAAKAVIADTPSVKPMEDEVTCGVDPLASAAECCAKDRWLCDYRRELDSAETATLKQQILRLREPPLCTDPDCSAMLAITIAVLNERGRDSLMD